MNSKCRAAVVKVRLARVSTSRSPDMVGAKVQRATQQRLPHQHSKATAAQAAALSGALPQKHGSLLRTGWLEAHSVSKRFEGGCPQGVVVNTGIKVLINLPNDSTAAAGSRTQRTPLLS